MRPKRLLSACLALALCLSLLPATALAADEDAPDTLLVGGTNVKGGGYWTTTSGTLASSDVNTWNVHYDTSTNTLTLKDADITGATSDETLSLYVGIYADSSSGDVSLNIELQGENTITSDGNGIYVYSPENGGSASLTITDSGSLNASGFANPGISVQSNNGDATLTIKNAEVTATSTHSDGVRVLTAADKSASLTVDRGSLTASGSTGILYGSSGSDSAPNTVNLTVSDSALVDARGGGIQAGGGGSAKDVPPTADSSGIVFDGDKGTVYGKVTLEENLTIGEGESLTIGDGASLDTNGKTITVESGGKLEGTIDGKQPPEITVSPVNQTMEEGSPAAFSVTASAGEGEQLTYQWQQKTTDSGSEWMDIPDATNATYTTGQTTMAMSGYQYRCVVTANGVSVISAPATLTVNAAATTITTQPGNVTVTEGETATFSVTATGSNLTYQWQQSTDGSAWANISGATGISYTTQATTMDMNGYQYRCVVTGNGGSVTSDAATLTVTAATVPVTGVTLNKTSTSLYVGDTETLTATVQPGNASNQNVTWSTSDASVATVENGVVRATGRGTATITVTTEDGGFTAGCTVTVSRYSTGGGPTTYAVTAPDAENGTVRVSPSRASRGTTVTITVTPDEGYELESLTVLDSRDNEITLTDKGDGKYTFTMPSGKVTVEASFAEIAPEPLPFGDVDDGDWFADAVQFVYENGMMNGVSETDFAPHATTSRSMIVTILYRLEGEPVVDYAMDFTDVAGDAYYAEAVRWAASEGIVGGYGGGLFGSEDAVTREQLAVILYRYAVYKGYDVSIGEDTNILSYTDFADLSEYAIPAMQWACGAGVITGVTDATLVPQGTATRAQCAAMLMRFCEAIG